ncbi:hypothetical protein FXO38_26370 [Capsicum annuum]|uniref:Ubiquitin-like protease family profile domain-containing protein n=1 Tax=Capsicum annuum TaxID=4072 RepID=A0A2G2Z0T5_CAPAN|nr:hypothetical protein FXO38_26370 [Capsicum annuum]KAF3664815.1 hypothetical protein FXO37_11327 [Capsicum annuum]PHT75608.1 hypothetical protein T459_19130 [Capsicum annuum]
MAQHVNRSISISGNKSMDLFSDELPSFSLGLTQDEVFNLGSSNIQSKGGVSSEGARLKHCKNSKNIVKKIKRKGLTKPSSPKPPKIQKSMKKTKPDEKGECSKISSPVSSDFEPEEEKVEEVLQEMKSICGLVSTRRDEIMNAISENKKKDKDNQVDNPPMVEADKTTSHHEFTLNFVHDLYKNSKGTLVTEDINGNQSASLMEVNNKDKDDVRNTKLVDNIGEAHISYSQFSFPNEVLRSINLDFVKSNLEVEDESTVFAFYIFIYFHKECDAEKILNPVEFNMDNSKLNQQNQSSVHIHVALTEERKAEQNFLDSQVTIPDELLPSLNAYLNQERSIIVHPSTNKVQEMPMHVSRIKRPSKFKESPFTMNFGSTAEGEYKIFNQKHSFVCHPINDIEDTKVTNKFMKWLSVDVLKFHAKRIDDASLNAGGKEYHLNEYINGFRMHATVPWHTVDHIFIPINVKAKHHWVLAVISFNDRCIYVYDSLSSVGHDDGKKSIDTANHPNYEFYDKMDLFDVYVMEDLPQQPSDSGNYGMKKEEENAQSDDEAPLRPSREIGLTEETE